MHDYIADSPTQYFVHLNSCVIRKLAVSMTFDAPPKRPTHSGKTLSSIEIDVGRKKTRNQVYLDTNYLALIYFYV